MVRQLLSKLGGLLPERPKRSMLLVFQHPDLGRCVLHHPDESHMLLAKGDVTATAARFYLKPYFKWMTNIDLHHYHNNSFKSGGVEYDIVGFDFPVVCDQDRALAKLTKARHQFIPLDQHRLAEQLKKHMH